MSNEHDDEDDGDDGGRKPPPRFSRLGPPGGRRSRVLYRDRYQRLREQAHLPDLIGRVLKRRGYTEEARKQAVGLYWHEIADERIASRTQPDALVRGVLQVSASSSSWVHEMQFYKTRLIAQINGFIDDNRAWLGPPPLVKDIRCGLGSRQRQPVVDPDQANRLRMDHLQRVRPRRVATPPTVTDADREEICKATSTIDDPELRDMIESVRLKHNR